MSHSRRRLRDIPLPVTLLWIAGIAAAVGLGVYASPPAPPPGASRAFPRMAGPAPDLPTLLYMLGVGSVVWNMAVIALPAMLLGARRVDGSRRRAVAVAVAAVVTLFVTSSALAFAITFNGAPSRPSATAYLPAALRQYLLPWVALVGIVAAIEARRRARASAIEQERLRAQVAEQRLLALTGQLQPHFLFNTLQGISTLIHRDPNAADEMLSKLSDLLRELLRHRDRALVTLGEEIRYTRTYLEIAELRFADRLGFAIDVPAALHGAAVPLFLLQPLVENALAHGIGGRAEGGRIVVSAQRDGDRLVLTVRDDGAGLPPARAVAEGMGLGNTRERLRAAFGNDQHLTLSPGDGAGCAATIDVPYRALEAVA